jgi:PIN domain nuclease of toxin-antitoxin system
VLLWALLEPQKLSPALRNALEDSDNTLVVSAASAWEIATKWRFGKLQHARAVVENYAMALHRLAAVELPISGAVAQQPLGGRPRQPPGRRQAIHGQGPTSISPRPRKKPRGSSVPPRWAWGWGPSKPLAARMQ